MPQLDKFSFASQIFWLLVLFFFMYVVLLKYVLPSIYKILKIRKEILDSLVADSTRLVDEEYITKNIHKELFSVNIAGTVDFLKYFQKRLGIFRNICNLFLIKGLAFTTVRNEQKNSAYILRLKKHVLEYLNV